MPAASRQLRDLEEVYSRLDARRAELHSSHLRLRGNQAIVEAEKRVKQLESELAQRQSSLRVLESEAEDAGAAIKKFTDLLYGGKIHDAREMASAETEIAHARERQRELEDRELELLEEVEATEPSLTQARARVDELNRAREDEIPALQKQVQELQREIEVLTSRAGEIEGSVDPKQLESYTRIRQRLDHAVSVVTNGTCQWCRVQVPSQDAQHARGPVLVTCANCGRILFAE